MFGASLATSFADPAAHRANSVARVIGEGVRARLSKLRVADLDAKPSSHPPGARRQRGETLIGLLLATGIAAAALGVAIEMHQRAQERLDAQHAGVLLAQTADGLRRLISAVPGSPTMLPTSPQTGVNWLKSPTCGGLATNPPQGFVPCSFGDNFWTPAFSTTFTNVAGRVEARLTFVVPAAYSRPRAGVLADIIAEQANANLTTSVVNAPTPGFITPGFVTVMSHVRPADNNLSNRLLIRANVADPDFARLVVSVANDSSTDTFLRTDGTNRMLANLNVNNNNLVAVRRLDMRTDLAGAVLGGPCTGVGEGPGQFASSSTGMLLSCQGGVWMGAGTQRVNSLGELCNRPGSVGEMSDGTGMVCQAGRWMPLQARMGGIVIMSSVEMTADGEMIPKPNCSVPNTPTSGARIFILPQEWPVRGYSLSQSGMSVSLTESGTNYRFAAIDRGAQWEVDISHPGPSGSVRALYMTACVFP